MGKDITWIVLVKKCGAFDTFHPGVWGEKCLFHHPHSEKLTKHEIIQGFLLRGQVLLLPLFRADHKRTTCNL